MNQFFIFSHVDLGVTIFPTSYNLDHDTDTANQLMRTKKAKAENLPLPFHDYNYFLTSHRLMTTLLLSSHSNGL